MSAIMSATEQLEKLQSHLARYQKFNSDASELFKDDNYVIDSCLFRVVYDTSNRSTFIDEPEFAPLAYPAFVAGCPAAPDCLEMQLLHCGGDGNHRDSTPYISCSKDLLWCLLSGTAALLQHTALNVQIWFIDNTRKHCDVQYDVWQEEYWQKVLGNAQNGDIDIAKERACFSSEVLVYQQISRERVLGELKLDLEEIKKAPAIFVSWVQETLENMWSYPLAVYNFFLQHPNDSGELVLWCELNRRGAEDEDIYSVCPFHAIYKALHPLSRDHIFISPQGIQMRSKLKETFPWDGNWNDKFWRKRNVTMHKESHQKELEDINSYVGLEEEEDRGIIKELMLSVTMERLGFHTQSAG